MKNITAKFHLKSAPLALLIVGLVGICVATFIEDRNFRRAARPEALEAADKFFAEVWSLQPGDIVDTKAGAFMVKTHDIRPSTLIVSGPGPTSHSKYRDAVLLDANLVWRGIANGTDRAVIIRKGDPGWETNASWFFLQ